MKRLKPLLTKAAIVAAFVLFTFGLGTIEGVAQQMADMPYDLHYIDMTIMHHQDGKQGAGPKIRKGPDASSETVKESRVHQMTTRWSV